MSVRQHYLLEAHFCTDAAHNHLSLRLSTAAVRAVGEATELLSFRGLYAPGTLIIRSDRFKCSPCCVGKVSGVSEEAPAVKHRVKQMF